MREHPFSENAKGLWCDMCGEHIATEHDLEDEYYQPPEDCTNCGWPDELDPEKI